MTLASLLVGAFEPSAKPWGMEGISEDFCFDEIAGDFDHFEPVLHDRDEAPACVWSGRASRSSSAAQRALRPMCAITWVRRPS